MGSAIAVSEKNHRLCVGCRQTAHRNQLWRIVRTYPDHQIRLDVGMGRSAYLCQQSSCLQAAQKKDRLSRALRTKVPPEIYQSLELRLMSRADGLPSDDSKT
ncbi:MAG: YlxR family protein [Cyanobacteria bacterium J06560_2]